MRQCIDLGIAVDIPGGLVTPLLRDMAGKSIEDLSNDWQALIKRVMSQRLKLEDYRGATVYLSNLGMFDRVTRFDAIVPLGACAILAVGASRKGARPR